jgi:hypothetical protein
MKKQNKGLTAEMVAEQMIKDTFSIEKKGEIFTTINYDLFGFLTTNREISQKNFNKLVASLRQKNVFGASTILVKKHDDGIYYIYEGQHRFLALKHLGLPIDYIVNQDLKIDDVSLMNTASEVWILKNFLNKFVNDGNVVENKSYHLLKALMDEYSNENDCVSVKGFTFEDILFITTGWGKNVTQQFKEGKLIITEEQYNDSVILCETIKRFMTKDTLPTNISNRKYIRAILFIIEKIKDWNNSDTDFLLESICSNKSLIDYKHYSSESMYVNLMVEIYNRVKRKRKIGVTTIGKDTKYFMSETK